MLSGSDNYCTLFVYSKYYAYLCSKIGTMTRQEFSSILLEHRKSSGTAIKDLCFRLDCMPTGIYRIENGSHNYNMQKCLAYTKAVGVSVVLENETFCTEVKDYDHMIAVLHDLRCSMMSQAQLANSSGISRNMIGKIETRKSIVTIDILLRLVAVFGLSIKIIAHE